MARNVALLNSVTLTEEFWFVHFDKPRFFASFDSCHGCFLRLSSLCISFSRELMNFTVSSIIFSLGGCKCVRKKLKEDKFWCANQLIQWNFKANIQGSSITIFKSFRRFKITEFSKKSQSKKECKKYFVSSAQR